MSTQDHGVILLASGLSQRLGYPKQLLKKNGAPLVDYMLKLALATEPQVVIVVIPKDSLLIADAIKKWVIKEPKVRTVINPSPETGMGHSLYLGVESLNQFACSSAPTSALMKRVLIMGIDQVLLDEAHLHQLLTGSATVVASHYSSWQCLNNDTSNSDLENLLKAIVGLPLVIDYPRLKQWQSSLNGDKGLRDLIRALPPAQLQTISNPQLSYDIDTPEQLNYAIAHGWMDG